MKIFVQSIMKTWRALNVLHMHRDSVSQPVWGLVGLTKTQLRLLRCLSCTAAPPHFCFIADKRSNISFWNQESNKTFLSSVVVSLLTNLNSNVACASCLSDVPQMFLIPNPPNHRNMSHTVECAENRRRCIWAVRSCRLPNFDQSLYEKGNTCEKVTFTDNRMHRLVKLITLVTVRKHTGGQERLNLFGNHIKRGKLRIIWWTDDCCTLL